MKKLIAIAASALLLGSAIGFNAKAAEPSYSYNLVTDASTLKSGDQVVIADGSGFASGNYSSGENLPAVAITFEGNKLIPADGMMSFTLEKGEGGYFNFKMPNGKPLVPNASHAGFKNGSKTLKEQMYEITITDGKALIRDTTVLEAEGSRYVGFNTLKAGPVFKLYEAESYYDAIRLYRYELDTKANDLTSLEAKSSLAIRYDEEFNPLEVNLRFGGIIEDSYYNEANTYGVIVIKNDEAEISKLSAIDDNYLNELIGANLALELTPVRVDKSGKEALDGGYLQFAWVIDNMNGHYNDSLYAVIYEKSSTGIKLSMPRATSVMELVDTYLSDTALGLSQDEIKVLNNIKGQSN